MRFATALFVLVAVGIVAVWAWLGASVQMPLSPFAAGEKLNCISYAPFRARQDPLGPDVPIDPRQIEDDLTQLALTDQLRPYLLSRPRPRPDTGNRKSGMGSR